VILSDLSDFVDLMHFGAFWDMLEIFWRILSDFE